MAPHTAPIVDWLFSRGFPNSRLDLLWLTVDRPTHYPPGGQVECAVLGPGVFERDLAGKCEAWTQYRFLRLLLSAGLTHHPSYTAMSFPEGTENNSLRRKTDMGRLAGGARY